MIAPSILSADFTKLAAEVAEVEAAGVKLLHVDVMDGHFVPNLTVGPLVVKAIRPVTQLILDCHLMVNEPEKMIPWFAKAGADWITFHDEAASNAEMLIDQIHALGKKAGISVRPGTPIEMIEPLLPKLDLVLVMSVEPGFGGQKFMPSSLQKCRWLAKQKEKHNLSFLISIDGGINLDTIADAKKSGAEVFVAGSAVFGESDRTKAIQQLEQAVKSS
jgi:ribulose-phosphate 3-epimerase